MSTIDLKAPMQWSDLTLDQFRDVVDILLRKLTENEKLLFLFCIVTGVRAYEQQENVSKMKFVTADGQDFWLKDWEIVDFTDRLRWMLDTVPDTVPNPTTLDDYLQDFSFGDWFETDSQFRLYEDDKDLAHFDIILPKLNEEVRPLTQSEATVLHLWWNSVMAQIAPMYPNVFSKNEGGGGECNPFKTLQEMHLLLNDDRPQDYETIDEASLHDVLSALDSRIEKMKLREAEYNRLLHS